MDGAELERRLSALEVKVSKLTLIGYLILGALIGSGVVNIAEWCL